MVAVITHAVTLEAQVNEDLVETNIGYFPWVVARNLAQEVDAVRRSERLGYFPPLEYLVRKGVIDPDLYELNLMLTEFCVDQVRRDVRRLLSRAFATTRIERVEPINPLLSHVRPRQEEALYHLARHLAPNRVRLELRVTSVRAELPEGMVDEVAERLHFWLGDVFDDLRVTSVAAA